MSGDMEPLYTNPATVTQWLTEMAPKVRSGFSRAAMQGKLSPVAEEREFVVSESGLLTTLLALAYATQTTDYLVLQHQYIQEELLLFLTMQTALKTPSPLLPTIPMGGTLQLQVEALGACRAYLCMRRIDLRRAEDQALLAH